ncbi:hypothetical protein Tdes44962_MAKER00697 [Teratosphaeria destructans]|uniref:Uncharacterized protein n=1 Tax=Teratosphaeria destructans TaxID=418781 RepID=A0A9W7SMF6_9PEZI|nr:hypothetical protein Tdes44962_MAKER00697 [Teratosphaeria destructans]
MKTTTLLLLLPALITTPPSTTAAELNTLQCPSQAPGTCSFYIHFYAPPALTPTTYTCALADSTGNLITDASARCYLGMDIDSSLPNPVNVVGYGGFGTKSQGGDWSLWAEVGYHGVSFASTEAAGEGVVVLGAQWRDCGEADVMGACTELCVQFSC